MENENTSTRPLNYDPDEIDIKEDSKITYVSGLVLSGSDKDIRFMLVTERLINNGKELIIKQESNQQIVIAIDTARRLNELLTSQLKIYD